MVGSASDPLSERHGWMAEEIHSYWNWAPGSSFLNNSEFSLTWQLAQNALPLLGLSFRAGLADMPDCARCGRGLEETAEHEEEIHSYWNWAPGSSFLNNSEFSLTWQLAQNALPLLGLSFRARPGRHARLCSMRPWLGRND